jgi:hypothetical protein
VNLGAVGVNADLDRIYAQLSNTARLFFVDHDRICFDLHVEHQATRILDDLKKIAAHEDFAATESQEENAGLGQLIKHPFDFERGHLAVVIVIEVAVHAALVTAISDVHVDGERDAEIRRFLTDLAHQAH